MTLTIRCGFSFWYGFEIWDSNPLKCGSPVDCRLPPARRGQHPNFSRDGKNANRVLYRPPSPSEWMGFSFCSKIICHCEEEGQSPSDVAISSEIFDNTYRRLPRRFAPRNDMRFLMVPHIYRKIPARKVSLICYPHKRQ